MKKIILSAVLLTSTTLSAKVFNCRGTDPFFGFDIDTSKVTLTPSLNDQSVNQFATNIKGKVIVGFLIDGRVIGRKLCNDGMTDTAYPFEILFTAIDGTTMSGCCEEK